MYGLFHSIAFTHRNLDVAAFAPLHIDEQHRPERFECVKKQMNLKEICFLSTCNRVEFLVVSAGEPTIEHLQRFFSILYPEFSHEQSAFFASQAKVYSGKAAIEHIFRVASSIDSLVVGEREIITQVRQAYEFSHKHGLSGDYLRILIQTTIETAKRVYTETKISQKPVSIVSIAYQRLQGMNVSSDARVLVIGAGVTNTAMCRFLKKHGMTQFSVFNRTYEKALALAEELGGKAYPLNELPDFKEGFDLLVTCTGAEHAIVDMELYRSLLAGETDSKITIDLALPNDIVPEVHTAFDTRQISVNVLQAISDSHLRERSNEVSQVEEIIADQLKDFEKISRIRQVEVAMRPVPVMVKEIRATAFNEIFKSEIGEMDENARETLEKVVAYIEKKYMSVPMKMAREILIKS